MVWIGKFKKEDETLDYTDAGKNVPEIKTNYSVTKEGFIEFKNNPENRINLDFNNNSTSNTENSSNNSDVNSNNLFMNNSSNLSGGVFDFLDSNVSSNTTSNNNLFQSPPSPNAFNPPSPNSVNNPEINKIINRISMRMEENSNEVYNLQQRIEMLERKISELAER